MADIVTLGIKVDTTQVKGAAADLDKLAAGGQRAERATDSLKGSVKELNTATSQAQREIAAFSSSMAKIGVGVGFTAVIAGARTLASELIAVQIQADKINTTFKVVAGSTAGAAREMDYVRKVAKELGTDLTTSATAYAKLAAAAKGTALEGAEARKIFEAMSKASVAMGMSADEANGALLAITQMISKGKVSMEELSGQLGERLPGAMQVAARAMGVTTAELMDMMQAGMDISEFLPAFATQLDTEFAGAATDAAQKTQASLNRLRTEMDDLKRSIAAVSVEPMVKAFSVVGPYISRLTENVRELTAETATLFERLGAAAKFYANMAPGVAMMGGIGEGKSQRQKDTEELRAITSQMAALEQKATENTLAGAKAADQLALARKRAAELTQKLAATNQQASTATAQATQQTNEQAKAEERAAATRKKAHDEWVKMTPRAKRQNELQAFEDQYGSIRGTTEYFNLRNALLKKHEDEIAAEKRKGVSASKSVADDSKKILSDAIAAERSALSVRAQLNREQLAGLEAAHDAELMTQSEFLQKKKELTEAAYRDQIKTQEAIVGKASGRGGDSKAAQDEANKLLEIMSKRNVDIAKLDAEMAKAREASRQQYIGGLQEQWDALNKQSEQIQAEIDNFGKSAPMIAEEAALRDENAAAILREHAAIMAKNGNSQEEIDNIKAQAAAYEALAKKRREVANNLRVQEVQQNFEREAKAAEDAWRIASGNIENWLVEAFTGGAQNARSMFRRLLDDIKAWFARLVLQPIIQPIMGAIGGIFGGSMGGGGMGGMGSMMGGGMGGGGGGFAGMAQNAYSAYNAWQSGGGFMGGVGNYVANAGWNMGSVGMTQFGGGMMNPALGGYQAGGAYGWGQTAGAVGNWATGVGVGIYGGRAISGGYSALGGQSGNTAVNIGTAIGAFMGPFGAAIGGIIGGVVNRAFGMKAKEYGSTSLNIGYDSAAGRGTGSYDTPWKQDGGWFRSDKSGVAKTGTGTEPILEAIKQFDAMKDATNAFAREIGQGAMQITSYSAWMKVPLANTGDAAKDAQTNLENYNKALGIIADDFASFVIPGIEKYAKGNETASQTLERLTATFTGTTNAMELMGKDSATAFGAVGLASAEARVALVDLAGGMEQLTALAAYFNQNYLSPQEQIAIAQKQLAEQSAKLGISANISREEIKRLVQAQGSATEAEAKRLVELLKLAQSYDQVSKAEQQLQAQGEALAEQNRALAQSLAMLNIAAQLAGGIIVKTTERIRAAGGGANFDANLANYQQQFEGEAIGPGSQMVAIAREMAALGIPIARTKDEFRNLVEVAKQGVGKGFTGAEDMYGNLIRLSGPFAAAHDSLKQIAEESKAALEAAEEGVRRARENVDRAWEAVTAARDRVADVHANWIRTQAAEQRRLDDRALQDKRRAEDEAREAWIKGMESAYNQAQEKVREAEQKANAARNDLTTIYNKEAGVLKQTAERFKSFAQSLRTFRDTLMTGDLSPKTPEQQYQFLTGRMNDLATRAAAGDEGAQGQLQGVVQEWLASSRELYASSSRYEADFQRAQGLLDQLATSSDVQGGIAEQQLASLKAMVESVLPELKESVLTVEQAIHAFKEAQIASDAATREAGVQEQAIEAAREEQRHIERMRESEDRAREDADANRQMMEAQAQYHKDIIAAERGVQDAINNAWAAERELLRAQDTQAAAWARHGQNLSALERIEAAITKAGVRQTYENNEQRNTIISLFRQYQGRMPNEGEVNRYMSEIEQGRSLMGVADELRRNRAPGFANGYDEVPYDNMPARLHKGERVLTNAQARAYDAMRGIGNNYDDWTPRPITPRPISMPVKPVKNYGMDSRQVSDLLLRVSELLEGLKGGQREQTNELVRAAFDSTRNAADRVVEGTRENTDKQAWRERARPVVR